jgi:type I restriction-modification system DNA methylase subunit
MSKQPNIEPIETKLWKAADKLHKNMDVADYRDMVLGLVFLKYIFECRYVGIPNEVNDGILLEEKIGKLTSDLREQMQEAQKLDEEIKIQLAKIGISL